MSEEVREAPGNAASGSGEAGSVWVFHAGALGDFVLIWPMLRAMRRAGVDVTVVAAGEKGALAAAELGVGGVRAVDAEGRRFTRLWVGDVAAEEGGGMAEGAVPGVGRVLTFVADPATEGGARWMAGAGVMFPGATVEFVGPPGSASRARAWREAGVERMGSLERRKNAGGPVVVHVGAGSRAKRWPMERWEELVGRMRAARKVEAIAGEVEAEQFTAAERRAFDALGGRICGSLRELAGELRGASLVIGCDTGPTHLAAQLGVATVALFGPTDPGVWAPVGPRVRVVAPTSPRAMTWLGAAEVVRAAASELGEP